ncbi:major facilitator superfamily domain-containing protein [Suillus bovinus]|uniref:major facilitator superfamily domain-containing protein n=1 Tax=Suillus bovinus TaxID=48563 RepID=UPI001B8647B2|nr:major facilitator superfamily domain-containing protein [Suillus bovinus]KAG2139189.1 major facilitator superfamily domain-containing protein [Suillus bovinus]
MAELIFPNIPDSSNVSFQTAYTYQPEENSKEGGSSTTLDNKSNLQTFLVLFDEDDSANPKNWSVAKKWYLTIAAALLVVNATFSSSAPSSLAPTFMEEFGISQEVATLPVSLFVCGYCVGPLVWAPLSEQYGRRPIFIISFIVYLCFQIGCALSQNIASILIFRFLGGTFAAAPLANSGALIADIWDAKQRGTALAVFSVAPFAGPGLAPTVAGYLVVAGVSWRWLFWILTILAGIFWLQIIFTIPETYGPVLLVKKAKELRKRTGDERFFAAIELQKVTFSQRIESILGRPFKILFKEPMMIAITLYMSFVYGCIYLLFEAYPVVFTQGHNLNAGVSGLMFLPLPIGAVLAGLTYIFFFNPSYERKVQECAPNPVPPEFRLRVAMVSAPFFVVSFFWFAWTSFPSISIWAPMLSGGLLGWSICLIFLALINYAVDAYLAVAASALAITTVIRSLFGAGFPLFATQMYDKLGPEWASSLLGFIALAMMPIPFVLSRYGHVLRLKSNYAPSGPLPSSSHA